MSPEEFLLLKVMEGWEGIVETDSTIPNAVLLDDGKTYVAYTGNSLDTEPPSDEDDIWQVKGVWNMGKPNGVVSLLHDDVSVTLGEFYSIVDIAKSVGLHHPGVPETIARQLQPDDSDEYQLFNYLFQHYYLENDIDISRDLLHKYGVEWELSVYDSYEFENIILRRFPDYGVVLKDKPK